MVGPDFEAFEEALQQQEIKVQRLTLCLVLMRLVPQLCSHLELGRLPPAETKRAAVRHALTIVWAVWARSVGLRADHVDPRRRAQELKDMLRLERETGLFSPNARCLLKCVQSMPSESVGFANLIREALEAEPAFTGLGFSAARADLDWILAGAPLTEVGSARLWPDVKDGPAMSH